MRKILFSHKFLFGLYLFIRQIELSIDRALHNHWKELVSFFSERIPTEEVIKIFQKFNGGISLTKKENSYLKNINKWRFFNIRRIVFKTPSLYEDELIHIYYILMEFHEYLKSNDIPNPDDLINLRMKCYDARVIIEPILSKKELSKAKSVIHFNHSDFIKVFELEEIIEDGWP